MREKLLNLTKWFAGIPSVSSDIEKLNEVVSFVENYVKENAKGKYFLEKLEFEAKPSIIIKNFDGKEADIVLNGHLDVVPPSEENQFDFYEEDWKLYGRWTWDMGAGCAIITELMVEILNSGFSDKKVMLLLTTDEEIWWENGVSKLVESGYTWDVVLIPDAGAINEIVYKEKWLCDVEFEIYWTSCHSATPWEGDDAIEKTYQFYREVKNTLEDNEIIYWGKNGRWWNSVVMSKISWWTMTNAVCWVIKGHLNIRFTEKITPEELEALIDDLLKKYGWKRLSFFIGSLLYSPKENEYIQKYLKICKRNLWEEVCLVHEHGASDGRYFSEKWSVVLFHKPTDFWLHSKGEYVVIDDLEKVYNCYREFVFCVK